MSQKFIGITLPIRRGQTGMFEQSVTILQQVRSNFKNLILTKKGERIGQPELGCDLWKILFEPITEDTYERARLALAEAVDRWLPFLELTDFKISTSNDVIVNIECSYRYRENPNVVETITVTAEALGLPTVSYPVEPTEANDIANFQRTTTATRIRRIN